MVSLLLGSGLPDDSQPDLLRESGFWRFILGFPIFFQVGSVLSMIFYIKYDSIRYLVNKGNFNEAREMIK